MKAERRVGYGPCSAHSSAVILLSLDIHAALEAACAFRPFAAGPAFQVEVDTPTVGSERVREACCNHIACRPSLGAGTGPSHPASLEADPTVEEPMRALRSCHNIHKHSAEAVHELHDAASAAAVAAQS